ncbi:hypothetical protein D3C81_2124860 [compost metagenome]
MKDRVSRSKDRVSPSVRVDLIIAQVNLMVRIEQADRAEATNGTIELTSKEDPQSHQSVNFIT